MPVNACSSNGQSGYRFGDSGTCYTYEAGNAKSRKQAKDKARLQEIAARASGWTEKFNLEQQDSKETKMQIQIPYDNASEIKKQHDSMHSWHQSMADSHAKAAAWHAGQSDTLSKALNEVPLDPSKLPTPTIGAQGVPTGEPVSPKPPVQNVPLDPMKKAEFVQILKDHADIFGDLGAPIEQIAEKLLEG